MSTPKGPAHRLPDKPVRPPSIVRETSPTEPPSDTATVLERLKAAQPRAALTTQDGNGARASYSSGPTVPESARGAQRTSDGGTTSGGVGTRPASGTDAITVVSDTSRAGHRAGSRAGNRGDNRAADRNGGGSGGRQTAERLRLTVEKARSAASGTGRAFSSSREAARRIGSWDADVLRQSVVTLCAVACILGSAAGVGAFGGPSIRDAAGGLFAPDATLLAPSSSAFSIWSVIYAGLIAYTVFQWLPSQRRTARQRRLGWTVAASMLLNLGWISSTQADLPTLSLVVIVLLLGALLSAVRTLNNHPNETRLEGALVDTPIGLYLGWVLLATAANAAAVLTAGGADLFGWAGNTWAIVGIVAVLITASVICSTDRGRLSVAAAASWGLLWIAVERALGQPAAIDIAFVAALAIFLLLITAGSRRHRVDHAYRRWLRAQEDAQREPLDLLADDYEDARY